MNTILGIVIGTVIGYTIAIVTRKKRKEIKYVEKEVRQCWNEPTLKLFVPDSSLQD